MTPEHKAILREIPLRVGMLVQMQDGTSYRLANVDRLGNVYLGPSQFHGANKGWADTREVELTPVVEDRCTFLLCLDELARQCPGTEEVIATASMWKNWVNDKEVVTDFIILSFRQMNLPQVEANE